jgi:hypothetical protein
MLPQNGQETNERKNREEQKKGRPKIGRETDQITMKRSKNLHRSNSPCYEPNPQKSSPRIDPNSGKIKLWSRTKKGKTKNTVEQKSHKNTMNPIGHEEDSGLHSHTKTQKNTTTNFLFLDLSQVELEKLTLGRNWGNESEEER